MSEPEQQKPIESPPEGVTCREHSDRPALVMCPECGKPACIACWHQSIRRCHACLMRDPLAAAPPIPWEDRAKPAIVRFFATIASAFRPLATAPAFAHGEVGPARSFALLTIVPLALLSGIVPFTQTLFFGRAFEVSVIGGASEADIALDVLRAAGIGLLTCIAQLLALALPYVSLARAYAGKAHPAAPMRVVLYRGFLVPLGLVLASIVPLAAPESVAGAELLAVAELLRIIPLLLAFTALRASARMGSGAGPIAALVVALVPLFAVVLVQTWTLDVMPTIGGNVPKPAAAATPRP